MSRECEAYRYLMPAMDHAGRLSVVIFESGRAAYVCELHLQLTFSLYPRAKFSPFLLASELQR